jgi:hypothetical protein
MIVACLISIIISGTPEDHIVTGIVKSYQPGYYVIDVSNAVSDFEDLSGDYSKIKVNESDCLARSR